MVTQDTDKRTIEQIGGTFVGYVFGVVFLAVYFSLGEISGEITHTEALFRAFSCCFGWMIACQLTWQIGYWVGWIPRGVPLMVIFIGVVIVAIPIVTIVVLQEDWPGIRGRLLSLAKTATHRRGR